MGHTRKRNYDRYTLAYKLQAVKLATRMHEQFSNIPESFRKHVIHTGGKSVEQVANEYRAGRKVGTYVLRNA